MATGFSSVAFGGSGALTTSLALSLAASFTGAAGAELVASALTGATGFCGATAGVELSCGWVAGADSVVVATATGLALSDAAFELPDALLLCSVEEGAAAVALGSL